MHCVWLMTRREATSSFLWRGPLVFRRWPRQTVRKSEKRATTSVIGSRHSRLPSMKKGVRGRPEIFREPARQFRTSTSFSASGPRFFGELQGDPQGRVACANTRETRTSFSLNDISRQTKGFSVSRKYLYHLKIGDTALQDQPYCGSPRKRCIRW